MNQRLLTADINMPQEKYNLKNTPLYHKHIELGAKMVPFSGWNMPVQYTSIIDEHIHTRTKAGLFDIFHMGEFFLKGPAAAEELEKLVTCRIDNMPIGKCRYGFMLNEKGGIIDDLIVFKISSEEFKLVVNAGTIDKDKEWIKSRISSEDLFADESEKIAKLDIQGPLSAVIVDNLFKNSVTQGLKRYWFKYADFLGMKVLLSRTGYTGELGYELFFPVSFAETIWDMILGFDEIKPIGLGARDTLRMEMGYSLYGNDIDENHSPFEANLGKFVFMEKDFIGKDALLKQKEQGFSRILKGFVCEGRRSARSHFKVVSDETVVGEVTSGSFSPCLKKGIGLCYIEKAFADEGTPVILTDGKIAINTEIKDIPVFKKNY
ncbi:MAG: glycine cleavage system aminomethyltransferase GcvT [Candidatus Omnitrophota bacterium]